MYKWLVLSICIVASGGIGVAADAESFALWPGKDARHAPGFQSMSEHPCGEVAIAKVSTLPVSTTGPLVADVVVELGADGKVIRRWPMPVDYVPKGIKGDELLVGVYDDMRFWIRSDGSFRRSSHVSTAEPRQAECDLKSVFGESAYARCSIFVDLASRKERRLGYQGPCT